MKGKLLNVITAVFICLAVTVSLTAAGSVSANEPLYVSKVFGEDIITVDIQVDADVWREMLDSATDKEYISCDVVINGQRISSVGLRTKGNSSLTTVAQGDSDRYSFSLKFNKYVKGQTLYGLDTLALNNIVSDASYMKDYISYEIMDYIGVPTPLKNYAAVTVNGEPWGFYLALERYDSAFISRNYNTSAGQLYSVKIGMGQRNNFLNESEWETGQDLTQDQAAARGNFNRAGGGGMGGMGGFSSGGGSLLYNGDDYSSYSSIFDNAVFNTSESDYDKIIEAIKNLNDGTELEKYFDVDEVLRYLAAHTVVVNLDSYTSTMQQNYYIYELDGKLSILPWDYNLSFGGFQSGNASSVVNFPVDTPVSGVSMEDRPLISKLLEVDEYMEKYHEYLRQIVDGYFNSGLFEQTIDSIDAKIQDYVKNDASAFFTYDQYRNALSVFKELGMLRAESIDGQLNGDIPSTTNWQDAEPELLVDASHISLSALGSQGGGGMGGGGMGGRGGMGNGMDNAFPEGMPDMSNRQGRQGQDRQGQERPNMGDMPAMGENWGNPGMTSGNIQVAEAMDWVTLSICGVVLAAGLIFAAMFRRRRYL